jgi:hypothetical protein
MEETEFQKFCKEALTDLLNDWSNGLQPANGSLDEAVKAELHVQFKRQNRAK